MGFDRAEFLDNLKTITGTATAAFPSMRAHFAALEEVAVNAIHEIAKEQELEDLFKGMRGSDGNVLSGGRQRRNGRREEGYLDARDGGRGTSIIDNIIMQDTLETIERLQDLYAEREQILVEKASLESQLFTQEELAAVSHLPPQQRSRALLELAREKERRGDNRAGTADQYADILRREKENEKAIDAAELVLDQQLINLPALQQQYRDLVKRRGEITDKLATNETLLSDLDRMRAEGPTVENENRIDSIIETRTDLEIELPSDATYERKIDGVKEAVEVQNAALTIEAGEIGTEIERIETAQETLNVIRPDAQIVTNMSDMGVEQDLARTKETNESLGLQSTWSFAMNSESPLEGANQQANLGEQPEPKLPGLGTPLTLDS